MKARILEQGNGLDVNVGDYAYADNVVYRITSVGSSIQTRQWHPNWVEVRVKEYGSPFDIGADEFDAAWNLTIQ